MRMWHWREMGQLNQRESFQWTVSLAYSVYALQKKTKKKNHLLMEFDLSLEQKHTAPQRLNSLAVERARARATLAESIARFIRLVLVAARFARSSFDWNTKRSGFAAAFAVAVSWIRLKL